MTETKQESENSEQREDTQNGEKELIWGQLRVPNIKKGYNPNYPFYMMGIFIVLILLSALFAALTDFI